MKLAAFSLALSFSMTAFAGYSWTPGPTDVPPAAFSEKSPTRIFLTGIAQRGQRYPVEHKIVEVYPYQERCALQVPYVSGKTLTATFSEGYEVYSMPFFENFGRTYGRGPRMTATTGVRGEIVNASLTSAYKDLNSEESIKEQMIYEFRSKVERLGLDKKNIPTNMTATILLIENSDRNAVVLKDMTFNVYAAEVSAEDVSYRDEVFMKDNQKWVRPATPRFNNPKVTLTYAIKGAKLSCPNLMSEAEINAASLK